MPFDPGQQAYIDLRAIVAEHSRPIVAWIGAGLSRPAGLPGWAELRLHLTDAIADKARHASDEDERKSFMNYQKNAEKAVTPWDAFKILAIGLKQTTFNAEVRRALAAAETSPVPEALKDIWRLRVKGIVTLNLDKLTSRAHSEVFGGSVTVSEFTSTEVGSHTHVLSNPNSRFLYHAHGVLDNVNSWVLTKDDLTELLQNQGYRNFIDAIFSTCTVVFFGLSVEDVSVGGHLQRLKMADIHTGQHFWITSRSYRDVDRTAEDRGIRIIRYSSPDGSHSELREILDDLHGHVSTNEPVESKPVTLSRKCVREVLPPPSEIEREEPELIRVFLNGHAQAILERNNDEAYAEYMALLDEYDQPIHKAWYLSLKPNRNEVLGYRLLSHEASGAFGKVYKALDKDNHIVALKIMHDDILQNHLALASFRRGVGSMQILSERQVSGMVKFLEAAEIPAMVAMEWVDGLNLREAVSAGRLSSLQSIVTVGRDLAAILHEAHGLPERVLHRDLRPANIMLAGAHESCDWTVKVLDFDLSWYRGAYDKTQVHETGTTGYLAPEQIQVVPGVSTRHSAVDSFGLGMTIYFMLSGVDPHPSQHRHRGWDAMVGEAIDRFQPTGWKSFHQRFARLILLATDDEQARRPDMTYMLQELDRLKRMCAGVNVSDLDIVCEELVARVNQFTGYTWSTDEQAAYRESPTGLMLSVRTEHAKRKLVLNIRKPSPANPPPSEARRRRTANSNARDLLSAAGWRIESFQPDRATIDLVASYRVESALPKIERVANAIDRSVEALIGV